MHRLRSATPGGFWDRNTPRRSSHFVVAALQIHLGVSLWRSPELFGRGVQSLSYCPPTYGEKSHGDCSTDWFNSHRTFAHRRELDHESYAPNTGEHFLDLSLLGLPHEEAKVNTGSSRDQWQLESEGGLHVEALYID